LRGWCWSGRVPRTAACRRSLAHSSDRLRSACIIASCSADTAPVCSPLLLALVPRARLGSRCIMQRNKGSAAVDSSTLSDFSRRASSFVASGTRCTAMTAPSERSTTSRRRRHAETPLISCADGPRGACLKQILKSQCAVLYLLYEVTRQRTFENLLPAAPAVAHFKPSAHFLAQRRRRCRRGRVSTVTRRPRLEHEIEEGTNSRCTNQGGIARNKKGGVARKGAQATVGAEGQARPG